MLRTRLLTAAIAIPGLWLIVEFVPPWRPPWGAALFVGFIMAVTAAGLHEYFAMALPEHPFEQVLGIMWGIVVAAGVASRRPEFWGGALALGLIGGLGLTLVRSADLGGAVQRLGLALLGVLYLGFFTPHIVLLRAGAWGWQWVLLTVFGAMGSDSGGYFAGRVFGRHKLAPAISPSKTYEGAIGAVAGAMLVAWLSHVLFFPLLGAWEAASIGAVISLLGQLGDLSESALKRAFGAKDSGWIIPGHGGILDRLDSILFPVVFTYYYAAFPRA